MTLADAKNVLRVSGTDNDNFIMSLIDALPGYIELTTGLTEAEQKQEPLVETVSGFILTLWYYADHTDDTKLQRTIDNLLKCIALRVTSVT
jgi:hypothetical protein